MQTEPLFQPTDSPHDADAPAAGRREPARAARPPYVVLLDANTDVHTFIESNVREALGEDVLFVQHVSGAAALRSFQTRPPDLILLGHELDDFGDALTFFRLAANGPLLRNVPIVMDTTDGGWRMAAPLAGSIAANTSAKRPLVGILRRAYRERS